MVGCETRGSSDNFETFMGLSSCRFSAFRQSSAEASSSAFFPSSLTFLWGSFSFLSILCQCRHLQACTGTGRARSRVCVLDRRDGARRKNCRSCLCTFSAPTKQDSMGWEPMGSAHDLNALPLPRSTPRS